MNTSLEDIESQINELGPWFHNIHLPDGTQTATDHFLGDFPSYKWEVIAPYIPEDLTGWNVLDIGCNAGFYSIQLAKRGANVLGIDVDPHYLKQAEWTIKQFGLQHRIELRHMQVYDLAHLNREFDLVWYMGVFYHLRYPLLSLDIISQITNGMLVFQTLAMPGNQVMEKQDISIHEREKMNHEGWPKMAFIEGSLAGDPTNWWAPNNSCIQAMLRSCGFQPLHQPESEIYICKADEQLKSYNAWNASEYLSATGKSWKEQLDKKVMEKATLS
ncbi:MAG TPA: TIGR04290 family methyltransferase [Cytophagaceae bacterium]|jgi:tRNA (mo5U34)-methyltransferase